MVGKAAQGVGFKNPPKNTRWKKGQSGNPAGRKKKEPLEIDVQIANELGSRLAVNENGRRLRLTKQELIIKQAINKAVGGDFKPLTILLKYRDTIESVARKNKPVQVFGNDDLDELSTEELSARYAKLSAEAHRGWKK